jgi:hypothetical protein
MPNQVKEMAVNVVILDGIVFTINTHFPYITDKHKVWQMI